MKASNRPRMTPSPLMSKALRTAGALVAVSAVVLLVTATPAAAQAGTLNMSPTSGSVGTVVRLSGDVGSTCAGQAAQFDGGTLGLEFQKGSGQGEPNEWINVPVAANGAWAATFVIPAFVGGQAMTQGSLGADMTPGVWQFGGPSCNAPARTADFEVTGTRPVASRFVGMAATPDGRGYWLAQAGGGVFGYGDAAYLGSLPSLGITPAGPITAVASTPDGMGYWLAGADGGVFAFGDAGYFGSLRTAGVTPAGLVVGITPTPDGMGYWLAGADGGVFAFGDAGYFGSARDGIAKVALLSSPTGRGYVIPTATGIEADARGDATAESGPPVALATLVSGAALTAGGGGHWEVGSDGGIFAFGDAAFYGSLPGLGVVPKAPVVGMARTPDGHGYWLVGADGGVFAFGDAGFHGSAADFGLPW